MGACRWIKPQVALSGSNVTDPVGLRPREPRRRDNHPVAFVGKFFKVSISNGHRHSECECGWSITHRDDSRVLQLDTYGSPDRKLAQKQSQSLQVDEEGARELLRILLIAFPSLRSNVGA